MRLINVVFLRTLSEIKLKRTDTTLDLSQMAKRAGEEKKKKIKLGRGSMDIYTQVTLARATLEISEVWPYPLIGGILGLRYMP